MNSKVKRDIEEVVCEVTEIFGFMFGDPADSGEEELCEPGEAVSAEVFFDGAASGRLRVYTSLDAAQEMSCNLLGLEDADPQQGLDTLEELVNQFCGQLLTTLAGEEPTFTLGIPKARRVAAGEWDAVLTDGATLCFLMDGEHPLLLRLESEGLEGGPLS
ncbi:MAG: chemotaxis protein CheX [Candidatus Hydrogenedentota bacterium]